MFGLMREKKFFEILSEKTGHIQQLRRELDIEWTINLARIRRGIKKMEIKGFHPKNLEIIFATHEDMDYFKDIFVNMGRLLDKDKNGNPLMDNIPCKVDNKFSSFVVRAKRVVAKPPKR